MAQAPPVTALAPWKFVLSGYVTDAAAQSYFAHLYIPFTPFLVSRFTHATLATKWLRRPQRHRVSQQQQQHL
jgi:hypothetical protein